MKCQVLFSRKNKKNISKCRLLKILPRVLRVKLPYTSVKLMIYWWGRGSLCWPNILVCFYFQATVELRVWFREKKKKMSPTRPTHTQTHSHTYTQKIFCWSIRNVVSLCWCVSGFMCGIFFFFFFFFFFCHGSSFFWCLGKTVLCDCNISWVSLLICLLQFEKYFFVLPAAVYNNLLDDWQTV